MGAVLIAGGEGSSSRESLNQNVPPAMLNAPASSFVVEVGNDTQSTHQQNISSIQPRQPVVSAAATSNLIEPSTVSDNSTAALEANSPKISEEDLLKWDANPLRNKPSRPSIAGTYCGLVLMPHVMPWLTCSICRLHCPP